MSEREQFISANIRDYFGNVPNVREKELMFKAWQARAAMVTAPQAAPIGAQAVDAEPVAWVKYAGECNVRIWFSKSLDAVTWARANSIDPDTLVPLYTADQLKVHGPAPLDISGLQASVF